MPLKMESGRRDDTVEILQRSATRSGARRDGLAKNSRGGFVGRALAILAPGRTQFLRNVRRVCSESAERGGTRCEKEASRGAWEPLLFPFFLSFHPTITTFSKSDQPIQKNGL